jgi:hypothetical protein
MYTDVSGATGQDISGHQEIAIMPDKCNPRIFYLIAGNRSAGHSTNNDPVPPPNPQYTKLELGLDINSITVTGLDNNDFYNHDFYGDHLADGRLGFANDVFLPHISLNYMGAPMHAFFTAASNFDNASNFTFAVSKRQADGERLLFLSSSIEIAVFTGSELEAAGNVSQTNLPNAIYNNTTGQKNPNTECELYQAVGSNTLRLANRLGNPGAYFYQDFVYNSGIITTSAPVQLSDPLVTSSFMDFGLEFSPNGRYLYVTSTNHAGGLAYFDLNQINPVAIDLGAQVNISNFKTSQIEVGKDDALYFCNGTQLGRLTNLNTPTAITQSNFSTIALPNVVLPSATATNVWTGLASIYFTLNDQVDGEPPYPAYIVGNTLAEAKCCIEHQKYTIDTYTVNGTNHNQVWSLGASNNPFGVVSGIVSIKNRLVIPVGYSVTINNMVFEYKPFQGDPSITSTFVDGAKCILQRSTTNAANGGQLTLNNTVFRGTSTCYYGMWDGIEVQGDPAALQQVIGGTPLIVRHQARLLVNSGSIIQDAYFGATNYEFDLTNYTGLFFDTSPLKSGGIIVGATNSIFKNNYIGVCFMPYHTANVLSNFRTTNFLVDAPLNNPLITPLCMAFIFDNKIMSFTTCNFKNSATGTYPTVPAASTLGLHGIIGFNASLNVTGIGTILNPAPYGTGCNFENLTYGVRAWNWTINTALIQSATFKNNWRGSYFSNYSGSSTSVTQRNKYFVYEYPTGTPAIDAAYGHYLDYCNNFKVQENRFYYNSYNETTGALVNSKYNAYGCIVNEENPNQTCFGGGYKGDEVYKNLFKEINIGAQAQGFNAEQPKDVGTLKNPCYNTNPNSDTEHNVGLKYTCNTFAGTDENDITVMYDGAALKAGRISFQQGGGTSAGNVHSHVTTPINCGAPNTASEREQYIDKTGINNTNPNYLESVYSNPATEKLFCFSPFVVAPNPGSTLLNTGIKSVTLGNPNTCPSKIGNLIKGSVVLASEYVSFNPLITNATLPLLQGDAQSLITSINTASAGQIQSDLLAKSPYLSDRVLVAAIRKNLPPGILKNIITPNSPVTVAVKTVLDSLPIPNGIRNQINAAQVGISPRRTQEGLLIYLRDEQHSVGIDAMTALLLDTINRNPDEIIKLLYSLGATDMNCQKIKTYLSYNDMAKAKLEADSALIKLGTMDPACQFLQNLVDAYKNQNLGAIAVIKDTLVRAKALAFSTNNNELDSRGAVGILQLTKKSAYKEWIQGKHGASNARLSNKTDDEALAVIQNLNFKVYPNPSAGMFYYEYNTEENNNQDATLTVIDMMGKAIITGIVNTTNAKGMINLSELPNGIYFINISNGAKQLFTSKLSVVK